MNEETVQAICWVVGVVVGTGLIEISPIKINPWSWLFSPLRKALVGSLTEKVDNLQKDLDNHIKESQEENALSARQRILRFNDEILQKQKHTKEHFDDILDCIDVYNEYCVEHPKFPNSKCLMAIKHIKDQYEDCLDNNSFLSLDPEIEDIRKARKKATN